MKMVPVSLLYNDMCRNDNECRVLFVHDCISSTVVSQWKSNTEFLIKVLRKVRIYFAIQIALFLENGKLATDKYFHTQRSCLIWSVSTKILRLTFNITA